MESQRLALNAGARLLAASYDRADSLSTGWLAHLSTGKALVEPASFGLPDERCLSCAGRRTAVLLLGETGTQQSDGRMAVDLARPCTMDVHRRPRYNRKSRKTARSTSRLYLADNLKRDRRC